MTKKKGGGRNMKKTTGFFIALIIMFLAIASPVLCYKAASVQADIQTLQEDFDRTKRGGTRQAYLQYDIEIAQAYIKDKDTNGLMNYCRNNDLDYGRLVDLLIEKGYVVVIEA